MASDDVEDRATTESARTTLKRASAGNGPVCPTMLIQDVLLRYPETWKVFVAHQLPCPRCMASTYETISQLASMLGVDLAVGVGVAQVIGKHLVEGGLARRKHRRDAGVVGRGDGRELGVVGGGRRERQQAGEEEREQVVHGSRGELTYRPSCRPSSSGSPRRGRVSGRRSPAP
ncbi:MAG: DUF1858 domain-containing protein [Verrucomicrobia bacterium]|nr:DUF1858 domain-containing protein [Verrucomicrobiota bacterium]